MNPLLIGKDLADMTISVAASAHVAATAGGSGDNTAVTGLTIDREALTPYGAGPSYSNAAPIGAIFLVHYEAALGAGNTLTLKAALVQDSADGTNWSTIYDQTGATAPVPPAWPAAGVVDTGATGGSTQRGCVAFGTDIQRARRYVRFEFTPDLSATTTDTANLAAVAVLSGYGEVPAGKV